LQWIEFAAFLFGGYLVGSIPIAYLLVKIFWGQDIRRYGSGQVGASNVFRSFSKSVGVAIGLYDAGKGVLLVWIAHLIGLSVAMQIAIGIAVVIGHDWPVFLRFNGGRGLATTVAICFYFMPWGILAFAILAALTLLLGSSPLPTLLGLAALPVTSAALHKPLEITLGMVVFLLILIIRRMTAPLTERSKQVGRRELYLYRFLFDRDIKDGRAWMASRPASAEQGDKRAKGLEKRT
jgi:glycerol-3-phosphate acyltransferase PlsY